MRWCFLCFFLLFAPYSGAQTAPAAPSWNGALYTNPEYGFTFKMPAGFAPVRDELRQRLEEQYKERGSDIRVFVYLERDVEGAGPDSIAIEAVKYPGAAEVSYAAGETFANRPRSAAVKILAPVHPVMVSGLQMAATESSFNSGIPRYDTSLLVGIRDRIVQFRAVTWERERLPELTSVLTDAITFEPTLIAAARKRTPIAEKVSRGTLVHTVQPVYPDTARQARIQGQVLLRAVIDKSGDVVELNVISGHPMLVQAAVDAVRQWKYKPFELNGAPVEVETIVTVNFMLAPS